MALDRSDGLGVGLNERLPCLPLQLEECNDLLMVDVLAIGMETLSLGTCPHLTSLKLRAPILQTLDLRCDTMDRMAA